MVDGGFCSVMTKYVLGECFRKNFNLHVSYDLTWFKQNSRDCDGELTRELTFHEVFPGASFEEASTEDIAFYKKYFLYENKKPYKFLEKILGKPRPMYFDGYSENWRYFSQVEDSCRQVFDFGNIALDDENIHVLNKIKSSSSSLAVHVRRGDYVNLGLSHLDVEYYLTAINRVCSCLDEMPVIFFFSDDMQLVKDTLIPLLPNSVNFHCVEINDVHKGYLDLYLISSCQHQISSNSSFGYWGALLNSNSNKIVVLPKKWLPNTSSARFEGVETAHSYPNFLLHEKSLLSH
mgnify:CR=1 FL=1